MRRKRLGYVGQPLAYEDLEARQVLTAAFDLVGITSLRLDPLFSDIDGRLNTGQRVGVAVLDSGAVASHPDLRNNFVVWYDAITKQPPSSSTAAAFDPSPVGHGTHVSGTAASSNPAYGVATGAGLIEVRVLPSENERAVGKGDAVLEGLNWVATNYQQYNIRVVNMSLGFDGNFNSTGGFDAKPISLAIDRLEALGITVVTSSGNRYAEYVSAGAMFPAITSTISVASVWPNAMSNWNPQGMGNKGDNFVSYEFYSTPDQFSVFSQRSTLPNQLVAPGSDILSTSKKAGGNAVMSGTSMASPLVAGVVALMQDAAQTFGGRWLSPVEVLEFLHTTADVIVDSQTNGNKRESSLYPALGQFDVPETGLPYSRINAYKALQRIRQTMLPTQDADATTGAALSIPALDGTRVYSVDGKIGRDGQASIGINDVDLYKLTLTSPGIVTAAVSAVSGGAAFDPYLRLFNSAGQQVAAINDTAGPYPTLSSIQLVTGTYYIGISSFNNSAYNVVNGAGRVNGQSQGDYRLTVSLGNPDPNGVLQGAVPYESWINAYGGVSTLTQYNYLKGDIGTDPPPTDGGSTRLSVGGNDVDMFEVLIPDSGELRVLVGSLRRLDGATNPRPFDTYVRVFDAVGNQLAQNDNGITTDSYVVVNVTRGQKVFVAVSESQNRSYGATNPYRPYRAAGTGDYDAVVQIWNRDANGTAYDATQATGLGISVSGVVGTDNGMTVGLDGSRDVDFYYFVPSTNGVLDVAVSSPDGTLTPSVSLWQWYPDQQEVVKLADSTASAVRHQVYVLAGESYYISVTGLGNAGYQWFAAGTGLGGDTGNYQMTTQLRPEADWWTLSDDVIGSPSIRTLPMNNWIDGYIGNDGNFYCGSNDVDLYSYVAPRDATVFFSTYADTEGSSDTFIRVFDSAGKELAYNDDVSDGTRSSGVILNVAAGQAYYVGISGWGAAGDPRAYSPLGTLSVVDGSMGSYYLSATELPTASFSGVASPTSAQLSSIGIAFSEPVTGVAVTDFTLTRNGVAVILTGGTLSGSGTNWSLNGLATTTVRDGTYVLTLKAIASNIKDSNGVSLVSDASVTWVKVASDTSAPLVSIATSATTPTNAAAITVTATFSEPVTGLTLAGIAVTNGVATSLTGTGSSYTFSITPNADGSVSVRVNAGAAQDSVANPSGASNTLSFTSDRTPPSAPVVSLVHDTGVSSTDGITSDGRIALQGIEPNSLWQYTTDSGVNWLQGGGFQFLLSPGPYTAGSIQVRQIDRAGNLSPLAIARNATMVDDTLPTAVFNGVASPRNASLDAIAIAFSSSVAGVSVADFTLTRNGVALSLSTATLTGGAPSWVLGNLGGITATNGAYVLTFNAAGSDVVDAAGNAVVTNTVRTWLTDTTRPSSPTSVVAVSGNGRLAVTWSAVYPPVSTGGSAITDYLVKYSGNNGATWKNFIHPVSTATSCTVTGLTNGTSYVIKVIARNAFGISLPSANSAPATPATVPGRPTSVVAVSDNTQLAVTWTAPASTGGSAITDYLLKYSSNGGGSWTNFTHPVSRATSCTVKRLTNGTSYVIKVIAKNAVGIGLPSANSAPNTPLAGALTPTFGATTSTADGFIVQISNYDASYTWAGTATAPGISISGSGLVTVTGVAAATSAMATITTTKANAVSDSALVTATSLAAALTPTFGATTPTANGFTVQIGNYNASYTWAGTATASGSVAVSGSGLVTVTGVATRTSSTATITTTRTGYVAGVAPVTATSLAAALTPTFGATTSTARGFTVQISNYNALYTWAGTATASGSVAVSGTGLVTVTNVATGTSSTATITTTRAGYAVGSALVTATSLPSTALTPTFGATTPTARGFTVQISNYNALYTWAGTATASGSVAVSGTGLVTVTGVAARTSSTATITTTRAGYAVGSALVTAASLTVNMSMVTVGNVGNAADTRTGSLYGAVLYSYQIGKYDVTGSQYTAFLNAVGSTDTYTLYNTSMGFDTNSAQISRSGTVGSYTYAVMNGTGSRPISHVSWFDSARFSNWMSNGQPSGAQTGTTTENGAYNVNGATFGWAVAVNATNPNTSSAPTFRIPLENEWYKAAYYSPNYGGIGVGGYYTYATQSNSAPGTTIGSGANQANYDRAIGHATDVGSFSGSGSFYGTFDQSGNVWQWNDLDGAAGSSRGLRGGGWYSDSYDMSSSGGSGGDPSAVGSIIGFRLASPV